MIERIAKPRKFVHNYIILCGSGIVNWEMSVKIASRKSILQKSVKMSYNGRMEKKSIIEYFEELETEEEYDGYYYSVGEAITLVILGSICGLRNVRQIWMWATQDRTKEF